jgi:hypothetical protein
MYWDSVKGKSITAMDNYQMIQSGGTTTQLAFYELEAAVVLDIILDENHPYIQKNKINMVPEDSLPNFDGSPASISDPRYPFIGRALVRPIKSLNHVEKEELIWAIPLESNISEYPLINEVVVIGYYLGNSSPFYSRKINAFNLPNGNPDFSIEGEIGGSTTSTGQEKGNRELYDQTKTYQGPLSKMVSDENRSDARGVAGRYFWINKNIRALKRHEGDTIIESRFGQSIRFGSYDEVRNNDVGLKEYKDYHGQSNDAPTNPYTGLPAGGGNPFVLIRNRQRPLLKEGEKKSIYDKIPPLIGTAQEKNSGGYILEDINYDGSSIHITCGLTISQFKTTCFKTMFQVGAEEQPAYSPFGSTPFVFPSQLSGDQIVMNSDRLIFQSRTAETFHFSKKRYAVVTDNEYTVDAHQQVVITSNTKTVLNSPAIYLGQYDQTAEPVLLGQTSVEWLYNLCNWLLAHTHWHKHGHTRKSAGRAVPDKTQKPVEEAKLIALRDSLKALLSRRVFVVGGGYAPGYDV